MKEDKLPEGLIRLKVPGLEEECRECGIELKPDKEGYTLVYAMVVNQNVTSYKCPECRCPLKSKVLPTKIREEKNG